MIYILVLLLSQCCTVFAIDNTSRAEIPKELHERIESIVRAMHEYCDGRKQEQYCRKWEESLRDFWTRHVREAITANKVDKLELEKDMDEVRKYFLNVRDDLVWEDGWIRERKNW